MLDPLVTSLYGAAKSKMISSLEFDCKLAHKKEIKKISNFSSVRQLYEKISQAFLVAIDQILFCTLNTHDFKDMNSLLGNYLSMGDLIVVHLCGHLKRLNLRKRFDFLGLTITDNGFGRAFVKRVNSQDDDLMQAIAPGQHIVSINSELTVGLRHYEVARALKEIPVNSQFTLCLIEPMISEEGQQDSGRLLNQDLGYKSDGLDSDLHMLPLDDDCDATANLQVEQKITDSYLIDSISDDLTDSSLPIDRLLRHANSLRKYQANYKHIIDEINQTLESFLGINDSVLAIQIYRLARENKESFDNFATALRSSELSVFKFGPDIEETLWRCASRDLPSPQVD